MAMIFPGMDPYLEDPQLWPGVHQRFAIYLADYLTPRIRPRYIAAVEERVFVEGPDRDVVPDLLLPRCRAGSFPAEGDAAVAVQVAPLEVHETYVTLLDRHSGQRVVTVFEILSPTNKYAGPGRDSYRAKQREVLGSDAHFVEIDLLRLGPHVLAVAEWAARGRGPYDYLVCVNRAHGIRDWYELYPRRLRERLPRVRIPLADSDPDVVLDVQAVLEKTYEAGSYADRLNYDAPCVPPLSPEDQAWADGLIRQARGGTPQHGG